MVRFLAWLDRSVGSVTVTERSAQNKLDECRAMGEHFLEPSFNSIPAYQANGAMMHYSASDDRPVELHREGFFLIDSGGNYFDGTTDITRTQSFGGLSERACRDYTLVLRGMTNLTRAVFLKGAHGCNLDVLARAPLWEDGLNYNCGTGHGIGFFLNVHEGPQNFSQSLTKAALEPGMLITNEPGVYREGEYGIRIENILLVVEKESTDSGTFYAFETLTLCPINTKPVQVELLRPEERQWLNDYHQDVYDKLSPHLDEDDRLWLEQATAAL
jgi:Xaa-Pro aminopeptidase